MNFASAKKALLEELIRMRSDGVDRIFLQDETFDDFQMLLLPNQPIVSESENTGEDFSLNERIARALPQSSSPKENASVTDFLLSEPPSFLIPDGTKQMKWEWLREKVLGCETCNEQLNPKANVVFGEGDLDADLFLCGEAPGADEEMSGSPFVGPAGELLMKILSAMGLNREQVYIANILNWRPRHSQAFGNRPPTQEEMDFCLPYLKGQLEIVEPKVVVALGKTATDGLLGHDPKRRLGQIRGSWHEALGFPMMVTYHPSYLLHNPSRTSKRKVWEDFLLVMEKLEMSVSEKQKGFFL